MIGNVLFFKKTNSFVSRVIANITKSEFTHVGLIVDYNKSSNIVTIIESDRFIKTRVSRIMLDDKQHAIYSTGELTDEIRERVVKYAYKSIGRKYDYSLIFGIFLSLLFKEKRIGYFNNTNRLICSELIDLAYYKAGVPRKNSINIGYVTPQELLEVYQLEVVRKGSKDCLLI